MSGTGVRQRLAAILAADAVGYSRLMAADERSTVTALDAARRIFEGEIRARKGRVVDMAGDSMCKRERRLTATQPEMKKGCSDATLWIYWRARQDLNPRPPGS